MEKLYAYIDGSDLEELEAVLVVEFEALLGKLNDSAVRFVNDRYERNPDMRPEDYPDWNIGLNVDLNETTPAVLSPIVDFLSVLSNKTNRAFAIGFWDEKRMISEDLLFVEQGNATKVKSILRQLLGVEI